MAQTTKRIIYYTRKPKKPILIFPTPDHWFNDLDDTYVEWKYNDSDIQASFRLEISTTTDFATANTWVKTGTGPTNKVSITTASDNGKRIEKSGVYYWRVQATGTQRQQTSDWSDIGTLNIDIEKPKIKGIDIVTPMGWNTTTSTVAGEVHSNMEITTAKSGDLGYYIGMLYNQICYLDIRNSGTVQRSFFGQVRFSELVYSEAQYASVVKTSNVTAIRPIIIDGKLAGFNFLAVVSGSNYNNTSQIRFDTRAYGYFTLDLRIAEQNLSSRTPDFNTPGDWNVGQYTTEKMKSHIKIGGAETPPYSHNNFKFSLSKPATSGIPIGKNVFNDINTDGTISTKVQSNSFLTNLDLTNIKTGDVVQLGRSYDKFQRGPKATSYLDKHHEFFGYETTDYFIVKRVDADKKTLTLDSEFNMNVVNEKFPYDGNSGTITYGNIPAPADPSKPNFTVSELKAPQPDGTVKTRKTTTINIVDHNLISEIVEPNSLSKGVGVNGLSARHIALREQGNNDADWYIYPIYLSDVNTLTVIGEVDSSLYELDLDYYICGDAITPTMGTFDEQISSSFIYIGAEDSHSGLEDYLILLQSHNVEQTTDRDGKPIYYIDRTLPHSSYGSVNLESKWKPFEDKSTVRTLAPKKYKCFVESVSNPLHVGSTSSIFNIRIRADVPVVPGLITQINDLEAIQYEILGCYATLTDLEAQPKYHIVQVNVDFNPNATVYPYVYLSVQGVGGASVDLIKPGMTIIIDTDDINPNINPNQGGLYSLYYWAGSYTHPVHGSLPLYTPAIFQVDKQISYDATAKKFLPNITVPDGIGFWGGQWFGYFWVDADDEYEFIIEGKRGFKKLVVVNGTIIFPQGSEALSSPTNPDAMTTHVSPVRIRLSRGWNRIFAETSGRTRADNGLGGLTDVPTAFILSYRSTSNNGLKKIISGERDSSSAFIPLNFVKSTSNDDMVHEIFVDVRDKAGNTASSSFYDMPSTAFRTPDFDTGKVSRKAIEGNIWISNQEKHPRSTNAVPDLFPLYCPESLNFYSLTSYNGGLDKVYSGYYTDTMRLYTTWNKWPVGAAYKFITDRCYALESDTNDNSYPPFYRDSPGFFMVTIKTDVPEIPPVNFRDPYQLNKIDKVEKEIMGCLAKFNGQSSQAYPIVSLWPDTSNVTTNPDGTTSYGPIIHMILQGVPNPEFIQNGTPIIVETNESSPNGKFSLGGLYAYYFGLNDGRYSPVRFLYNETINFVGNRKLGANLNFADYSHFLFACYGYVWCEYDAEYEFIIYGTRLIFDLFSIDDNIYIRNNDPLDRPTLGTNPTELRIAKIKLDRGWHRIHASCSQSVERMPSCLYAINYRSNVLEDNYVETINGQEVRKLPVAYEIREDNTVKLKKKTGTGYEDFKVFKTNELADREALLKLLNAKTGYELVDHNESVSSSNKITYLNGLQAAEIDIPSQFFIDPELSYYLNIVGDFGIHNIDVAQYEVAGEYSVLYTRMTKQEEAEIEVVNGTEPNYRIGRAKLKILSNTEDTLTFYPATTGTWTKVSQTVDGTQIVLEDTTKLFVDDLKGMSVALWEDESTYNVYYIAGQTSQSIIVNYSGNDYVKFLGQEYRIGDVRDVLETDDAIYIPIGQPKTINGIPSSNLIRNAAKVSGVAADFYDNVKTFTKAISLKDTSNVTTTETANGTIIEYDINRDSFSTYVVGDTVYDANETENVVGIYESRPLSAPSGFSYWKLLSWQEDVPSGTSVEFYIRTAETEQELANSTYNLDAFGRVYPAFTSSMYDSPKVSPKGIDIAKFSTNGEKNSRGDIKRLKWIQFKVVLKSSTYNITPKVDKIRISYASSEERIVFTKNFELKSNITRGFITANVELPEGTSILWGINTSNETDFNRYQIIPLNEAFEVIETNSQFRLAAKLVSSGVAVPKILNFGFMFNTEDNSEEMLNQNLSE